MKTKPCRCCSGSGKELDNRAVGKEMNALRLSAGISLKKLGQKMNPPLSAPFLCDLEHGHRNWYPHNINQYRKLCSL